MPVEMTSRERILTTIAGGEIDHVPLSIDIHPSYADPLVGTWKDQFERTDFLLGRGLDPMTEIWLPEPEFHPDVKVESWKETEAGRTILHKRYGTPAGELRQAIRETDDLYSWHRINRNTVGPIANLINGLGLMEDVNPSRSLEYLVTGPEDLEKMRYLFRIPTADALEAWRADACYAKKRADAAGTLLLARRIYDGSAILWLTDAEDFMCRYDSDAGFVEEFLDIIHRWQLGLLDLVLDIGVDMVTRFGYYDTPDFWGVRHFERYLKPLMDTEGLMCEQAGALLCQQQSEGLTQQVDIYKTMKVHVFRDVDPVQGGEDMLLLKKELGRTRTLMGGINSDLILAGASKTEIETLVRDTLAAMAPGGRFILYPIPGIYAGVPWTKVEWLIDAWEKYA